MKSRRSRRLAAIMLPSPIIAVAVGVLCVAYVQLSHSASISGAGSATSSGTNKPSRITSLRTNKPRMEVQAGRMKASDIKACISKAFCEVNSASKKPNYAVNKEFFDLMNQIHALSDEDLDSGSTSVEYDDDDDEEDDDVSGESSEEASSERLRGYPPPPPPPPPGYRRGRLVDASNGTEIVSGNGTETGSSSSTTVSPSKIKDKKSKKHKSKKSKVAGQKMVKKYVNGTFVSVPKRRSRIETAEEKAEKQNYVTRKQREMGQVNDLAALIRISADIGLTLRSPRKCRTLFNKCTMTHEQIVDLFNQTLMAVTTPSSGASAPPSSVPTTKRAKVTTTLAAASTSADTPPAESSPLSTVQEALTPTFRTTLLTTQAPTTTTVDDGNRSSKSRHDFSDEDVEYMTDTEIAPVQTYALFVNDAPEAEDTQKTAEEVVISETFKKYANAFPVESALPGDMPSLRKRSNKKKNVKVNGNARSSSTTQISKRGRASSEEDEDDEDEDDDDAGSMSVEETTDGQSGFRIENPYPGYRVNKGGLADDDKSVESSELSSAAIGKEDSSEGILPPLVEKEKPKNKDEEEDDEDEDSEESAEADDEAGLGLKGYKEKGSSKLSKTSKRKSTKNNKSPSVALEEDESSEEDDAETADDQQSPPPWNPVYQRYMSEKKKQGYKKKQKGPYKGGEGLYDDSPSHHTPQSATSSLSSFLQKPWGGGANSASQEIPGAAPVASSHESAYPAYHNQHYHGGHGGPPGGPPPYGNSQETGGVSEQKPGFFQSIMSWFTGGNKGAEPVVPHQGEGGYGGGSMHGYGGQASPYGGHGHGHGSIENDEPEKSAGAPWPSQPDPAGVGHFGQSYRYRGYKKPEVSSEEEDEELVDEPAIISKKNKKTKRRYRGRSDSIITSSPKKSSTPAKKSPAGPPPPIVVVPKDSKSVAPSGGSPVGVYEPNHQYEKLIQADGGLTSTSNAGKKVVVVSSTKENKRAKKAAVKPKKQQNKKSQKQSQRAAGHRNSRESQQDDDDDEMYSSEEIFNQQLSKLKSGAGSVTLGGSISGGMNAGGNNNGNKHNGSPSQSESDSSFPSYFESMFGTEEKDKYKIRGQDDGSLLYGFDSLSSQLSAAPLELPVVQGKKKVSSYKVNKNKTKKKNGGVGVLGQPVKFNNKEVIESSEEEADDKRKRK